MDRMQRLAYNLGLTMGALSSKEIQEELEKGGVSKREIEIAIEALDQITLYFCKKG